MSVALILATITLGALALRYPALALRPLHHDEATNTEKFADLYERADGFKYDPHEFHGPTLYYFTLPGFWLTGSPSYGQSSELHFRLVTVIFGLALIPLLWLFRGALTDEELLAAGILTAVSSIFVFYSRYYIHEMLLVAFTMLAMGGGWRFASTGRTVWLMICAAALGLMYATKETWAISVFAMAVALGVTWLWNRLAEKHPLPAHLRGDHRLLIAGAVFVAVAALFFSSFFSNLRGPWDAVRAYLVYFSRGTGNTEHNQPFLYYFKLLSWHRYGRLPVRSEAFILVAAAAGILMALRWPRLGLIRRPGPLRALVAAMGNDQDWVKLAFSRPAEAPTAPGRPRQAASPELPDVAEADPLVARVAFLRFLAIYTLVTALIYSLLSYKTPWCALTFFHGMILLAGVAIGSLLRLPIHPVIRMVIGVALALPVVALARQSREITQNKAQVADERHNPYLYSHPSLKFYELPGRIARLASANPRPPRIRVITGDCWPLPFYLRGYKDVDYNPAISARLADADIIIMEPEQYDAVAAAVPMQRGFAQLGLPLEFIGVRLSEVERYLDPPYFTSEFHGLRRREFLMLLVRQSLWDAMIEAEQRRKEPAATEPATRPAPPPFVPI